MNEITNPNMLSAAGLLFAMCGVGLLGKAILIDTANHGTGFVSVREADDRQRRRAVTQRSVDTQFGLVLLGIGFFVQLLSHVAGAGVSFSTVALLLVLAFIMLMYAMMESSIVEAELDKATPARELPKPALIAKVEPMKVEDLRPVPQPAKA